MRNPLERFNGSSCTCSILGDALHGLYAAVSDAQVRYSNAAGWFPFAEVITAQSSELLKYSGAGFDLTEIEDRRMQTPGLDIHRPTSISELYLSAHVWSECTCAQLWSSGMARTTHRSRSGTKLYAKRSKAGKFTDIQTYKRAQGQDVKRSSAAERAATKKKSSTKKKSVTKKKAVRKRK